jgi:hypothetical protein
MADGEDDGSAGAWAAWRHVATTAAWVVPLGAIAALTPAGLLFLTALGVYSLVRWLGYGSQMGREALEEADRLILGLFLAAVGVFALIYSRVTLSGLALTAMLTGLFVRAHVGAGRRLGWVAIAVVSLAWACVGYRAIAPRPGPGEFHIPKLIRNVE